MTAIPQSPTVWLVTADTTLVCTQPGCGFSTSNRILSEGECCSVCMVAGREGRLEMATFRVDLEEYDQTGRCDCHDFRCRLEPIIKTMSKLERMADRGRCKHIIFAREQAKLDDNFDALLAMLPNQSQE